MKSTKILRFGLCFLIAAIGCVPTFAQTNKAKDSGQGAGQSAPAQNAAPPAKTPADDSFIIGDDDLLAISVCKEADLTKQIPVRADGMISLPLIGDIKAAGRTPAQLQQDITNKLQSFITDPQVSVIVQEIRSLKFNVLGQVAKPGTFSLTAGTTIVDAIALAGGFRDFAKTKGVYILRKSGSGTDEKIPFNYQTFIKGKDTEQNIVLKPRDTVVVP